MGVPPSEDHHAIEERQVAEAFGGLAVAALDDD